MLSVPKLKFRPLSSRFITDFRKIRISSEPNFIVITLFPKHVYFCHSFADTEIQISANKIVLETRPARSLVYGFGDNLKKLNGFMIKVCWQAFTGL